MFKKSIKKINNKKGIILIQVVLISLAVIMALAFLTDILSISWKYNFVSQTSSDIARTLGEQSGIRTSPPDGFPGGREAYTSSRELYSQLKTDFASAGFEDDDWTVYVGNRKLRSGSNIEYDYGDTISITIVAKYNWNLFNNYLGDTSKREIKSTKNIYANFQERTSDIKTLKGGL